MARKPTRKSAVSKKTSVAKKVASPILSKAALKKKIEDNLAKSTLNSATEKKSNLFDMVRNIAKKATGMIVDEVKQPEKAASNSDAKPTTAQVDNHCPDAKNLCVVSDEKGTPLSCYLMWTDLKKNHNKFYVAQVLQPKNRQGPKNLAILFTRYGRVGQNGVSDWQKMDYLKATKVYGQKTRAKQSKGYTKIELAEDKRSSSIAGGMKNQPKPEFKKVVQPDSKLPLKTQELVKFIFNESLMEAQVVSTGLDMRRMPLGALSKETVLKGYTILKKIEDEIAMNRKENLLRLSGEFYTQIPHNFGMKKMHHFVINTNELVMEKLVLMHDLLDMQVAKEIADESRVGLSKKGSTEIKLDQNQLDSNYDRLKCKLTPLKSNDNFYKTIEKYV